RLTAHLSSLRSHSVCTECVPRDINRTAMESQDVWRGSIMANAAAVTDANFEQEVLKSSVPVLVDFWAAWCGPCKVIAPTIDQLAVEYAGKMKVVKVDVDSNMEISSRYSVLNIPTLMLFKDGHAVEKMIGALPKPALLAKIQPHLS